MKIFLFFLILLSGFPVIVAAQTTDIISDEGIAVPVTNNEQVIKNSMVFNYEFDIKKPLILVNGESVYTLAFYNREEFKQIIVLQPKEGYLRYHYRGRNGVIMAQLKDAAKKPGVLVTSNRIYYQCKINNTITDTSEQYGVSHGIDCTTYDLRDTGSVQTLYFSENKPAFVNAIRFIDLGVGWDRAMVSIYGGSLSGSGSNKLIRVKKEGLVKLTITTARKNYERTEIVFRAVKLPADFVVPLRDQ